MFDWLKNKDVAVVNDKGNFFITTDENYNKRDTNEYNRQLTLGIPDLFASYDEIVQYLTINLDIPKERLKNYTDMEE